MPGVLTSEVEVSLVNKLHIEVQPAQAALTRFGSALQAVMEGRSTRPYSGIGFENMAQFGEVFTPKRWELAGVLKASGPMSIYALAKRLNRHYPTYARMRACCRSGW